MLDSFATRLVRSFDAWLSCESDESNFCCLGLASIALAAWFWTSGVGAIALSIVWRRRRVHVRNIADSIAMLFYQRRDETWDVIPDSRSRLRPVALYGAGKGIVAALPTIKAFAEELAAGGLDLLDAIVSGDAGRLGRYSELARDIGEFAGDMLLDLFESLSSVDAETRGKIVGFALYSIAESMLTSGAGAALKSEAVCNAARALSKGELLKGYPKVVASLEKSIDLITKTLKIDICFVAGTSVHTPGDLMPIEAIRVGDTVLSRSERDGNGANVVRRVTAVAITHPIELVALEIETSGGVETLRCTPGHPLFEAGCSQFVSAEDLSPGDHLALADSRTATIRTITHEDALPGETFTTYNFAVEDCHAYFAGRVGVWAHNAGERVCSELASVYRQALRKGGKSEEATAAVVDRLAKMLAKPGADAKAIEAELAKSKIPGLTPKEFFEKAGAKLSSKGQVTVQEAAEIARIKRKAPSSYGGPSGYKDKLGFPIRHPNVAHQHLAKQAEVANKLIAQRRLTPKNGLVLYNKPLKSSRNPFGPGNPVIKPDVQVFEKTPSGWRRIGKPVEIEPAGRGFQHKTDLYKTNGGGSFDTVEY